MFERILRESTATTPTDIPLLHVFYRKLGGDQFDSEAEWLARAALLEAWMNQNKSDASKIALAYHLYRYGWWIRGTKSASGTFDNRMDRFRENLDDAQSLLISIANSSADNPAYWELMLYLGTARSIPRLQFEAYYAIAALQRPDYFPIHAAKAQFLEVRWHGSNRQFRQFVDDASVKFDPIFEGRLLGRLEHFSRSRDMFSSGRSNLSKIAESFERIFEKDDDPENYFQMAKLACIAQDWVMTETNLVRADSRPTPAQWPTDHFEYCAKEANSSGIGLTIGELRERSDLKLADAHIPEIEVEIDAAQDAATIAELANDQTQYSDLLKAVNEIAERNPKVLRLLDDHSILLLEKDLERILLTIAQQDVTEAIAHLDKLNNKNYTTNRIKRIYQQQLEDRYYYWLIKYPALWGGADLREIPLEIEELFAIAETHMDWLTILQSTRSRYLKSEDELKYLKYLWEKDPLKYMFGANVSNISAEPIQILEFIYEHEQPPGKVFNDAFSKLFSKDTGLFTKVQEKKLKLSDEVWGGLISAVINNDFERGKTLLEEYPQHQEYVFEQKKNSSRFLYKEEFPDWLLENPYWIETKDVTLLNRDRQSELLAFIDSITESKRKESFMAEYERIRKKDPGELFDALDIPSSRLEPGVGKLKALAQQYPQAAQNWALQNQSKLTLLAIREITNASLRKEIESTYSWLQSLEMEGIPDHLFVEALKLKTRLSPEMSEEVLTEAMFLENPSLLMSVLEPWWVKDRATAEAWVANLKSVPMQQSAFRILGDQYAMRLRDYSTATDYYKKILDEGEQLGAIFNLLPILYVEDRALFDKLAVDVQLSPRELEEIQEQAVQAGRW